MLGWFKKKKTQKDVPSIPDDKASVDLGAEETQLNTEEETLQGTGIFGSSGESEESTPPAPESKKEEQPATKPDGAQPQSSSLMGRLAQKLSRTRESLVQQMDTLFLGKKEIDAELLDDLEELLITADIGAATAVELLDYARKKVKRAELSDPASLKKFIKERLRSYIVDSSRPAELVMPDSGPFVIMVVGVNGVGKTTTIGKIAHKFLNSGQTVLLAAGDTFRAAAVSQLKIWGERSGIEVVCKGEGADPSSVAFDAVARAVAENYDVVLVDTAGRLHTQTNLMEELKKIRRVINKKLEGAPHEVLLVIDATTGQNGISQAKLFNEAVGVTGLALTKLDGTAKGGIVANISRYMDIPIRFIGIGEKIEDLRDFDPDEFIEALFQEKS
jgi:fused signal recognition particle receptor